MNVAQSPTRRSIRPAHEGKFAPYTAQEAAALLGVNDDTVRRRYQELGGYKVGTVYRFPRPAIDERVRTDAGAADEPAPAVDAADAVRDALLRCVADAVRHLLLLAETEAYPQRNRERHVLLGDLAVLTQAHQTHQTHQTQEHDREGA